MSLTRCYTLASTTSLPIGRLGCAHQLPFSSRCTTSSSVFVRAEIDWALYVGTAQLITSTSFTKQTFLYAACLILIPARLRGHALARISNQAQAAQLGLCITLSLLAAPTTPVIMRPLPLRFQLSSQASVTGYCLCQLLLRSRRLQTRPLPYHSLY